MVKEGGPRKSQLEKEAVEELKKEESKLREDIKTAEKRDPERLRETVEDLTKQIKEIQDKIDNSQDEALVEKLIAKREELEKDIDAAKSTMEKVVKESPEELEKEMLGEAFEEGGDSKQEAA